MKKYETKGINEYLPEHCSRREFLFTALSAPIFITEPSQSKNIAVPSPDGGVLFELPLRDQSRLSYRITFRNQPVIETSALGMVIDGIDLGDVIEVVNRAPYRINERYACRGVHSEAVNRCNGAQILLKHKQSGTGFTLEVRTFNEGVAFRFILPGDEKPRVPDETTLFTLPEGRVVWSHDFEGHYEGMHTRKAIAEVAVGEWAAPPLTIKLPNGAGYASITEAALINYAGMGLQSDGRRGFKLRLGHMHPASYPFRLRYAADVERLKQAAAIGGTLSDTAPGSGRVQADRRFSWRKQTCGRGAGLAKRDDARRNLRSGAPKNASMGTGQYRASIHADAGRPR